MIRKGEVHDIVLLERSSYVLFEGRIQDSFRLCFMSDAHPDGYCPKGSPSAVFHLYGDGNQVSEVSVVSCRQK